VNVLTSVRLVVLRLMVLNFPSLNVLILSRLPQLLQFHLLLSRFESLEAHFEKCV